MTTPKANRIPVGSSQIMQSGQNFRKGYWYGFNYSNAFVLSDQGGVLAIDLASSGGVLEATEMILAAAVTQAHTEARRGGARKLDLTGVNLTGLVARFKATIETSSHSATWSAQAYLYDITHGVLVANSTVDNSAAADKAVASEASAQLTLGSAAGDLRTDTAAMYAVLVIIDGTPVNDYDHAILSGARIELSYE